MEMLISASELYGDRKYLLNTSGVVYRSMGSDAVKKMSDNELFEQLIMEPRLITVSYTHLTLPTTVIV